MGLLSTIGTGYGIASELLSLFASPVVAIFKTEQVYTQSQLNTPSEDPIVPNGVAYNQVFSAANIMKATVIPSALLAKHPLENGSLIADHKIIYPIRIELRIYVKKTNYQSVFSEVRDGYNFSTAYTIQLKFGTYSNMVIVSAPHEEDAEHFDMIMLTLQFEEVVIADDTPTGYAPPPASPDDGTVNSNTASMQDTSSNGLVSPASTSITVTDLPPLGGK